MNKDIMRKGGFGTWVDKVEQSKCPVCNEQIDTNNFKDDLSLKEFHMSGLCQVCQDKFFDESEED